jgi:hypothetical protein
VGAAVLFTDVARAQEATGTETAEPAPANTDATVAPVAAVQPANTVEEPPRSNGTGLIIGGWVTFGVLYAPALIAGIALALDYGPNAILAIPALGPIIVGALAISAGNLSGGTAASEVSGTMKAIGATFIIWGVLQMGAIAMLTIGHVQRARWKKSMGAFRIPNTKIAFQISPIATRESMGLGLTGTF